MRQWLSKYISLASSVYSKRSGTSFFNIWIPSILGTGAFLPRFLDPWYGIPLGVCSIGLLSAHTYFLKVNKDKDLHEINYWKKMSDDYQWVLYAIRRLIYRKKTAYQKFIDNPKDFGEGSIYKTLEMLYQFYVYRSSIPVKFRISFFVPSTDNSFLTCSFYDYGDDQRPHFYRNKDKECKLFDRESSNSLAVKAWKTREVLIAESPKDIPYHYDGQHVRKRQVKYTPQNFMLVMRSRFAYCGSSAL